jgi:CRISPR-associated protein Csx17
MALGVLRLVAEQADLKARGGWRDDAFVLRASLSTDALVELCLQQYVPTPIVGPWNGSGGFHPGDRGSGSDALAAASASPPERRPDRPRRRRPLRPRRLSSRRRKKF